MPEKTPWKLYATVIDPEEAKRLKRRQSNARKGKQAKVRKRVRKSGVRFDVLVRRCTK